MKRINEDVRSKNYGYMPIQKLPHAKKNKEWREMCVDYIIGHGGTTGFSANRTRLKDMQMHYDLYNSIYDESDLKYVTNPFKQRDGFPASARDFNIIRPKIDALIGEELNKTFTYTIMRTSSAPMAGELEKAKQMIADWMMASIMADVSPAHQQEFEAALASGEIQPPEQVLRFLQKDYRDNGEEAAYYMIKALEKRLNLIHEFSKGWKDALISAEEFYHVYELNGNPMLKRINPMYFSYEYNPNIEFIHEASWCVEHMRMSYSGVYDMLYEYMDEKDLEELMSKINGLGNTTGTSNLAPFGYNAINLTTFQAAQSANAFGDLSNISVWHVCWKSFRKIGFLSTVDPETGEVFSDVVDETYKLLPGETIEWRWVSEVWHGYRVGDDMYVGIEPLPNQKFSIDRPNYSRLPYTGIIHSNTNSLPRSLVSLLKPLQDMYIIIWYRLELAIARDNGRVPIVDITQIPESAGIDFPRWMHMLKSLGVMLINPYEKGEYDPGREGGRAAQFNQWSSIDLSMSQSIIQYSELLMRIEGMVSMISGISPAREGVTGERELVNNVQSNIIHSSNITAPWFWMHSQAKRVALQNLLDLTKEIWRKTDKKYVDYVMDDGTRIFLNIAEDFFEDMDIYVTSDEKDLLKVQQLQNLFQPAMQNGATLLDVAEIITLENTTMIKNKLKEIEANKAEQMQAMQEQQAQMAQQQTEAQMQLESAKLEMQKYKTDADNQTRLAVAEIGAFRFQDDLDQNNNGALDPIEVANTRMNEYDVMARNNAAQEKINLERDKVNRDSKLKEDEIKSRERMDKNKESLEREKMRHAERLQAQKDKSALEREKLKAATAIKNRVSGEKPNKPKSKS